MAARRSRPTARRTAKRPARQKPSPRRAPKKGRKPARKTPTRTVRTRASLGSRKTPAKAAQAPPKARRTPKPASDSSLAKEIRSMTGVFAENQRILVSMGKILDGLGSAVERSRKESKRVSMIEDDTRSALAELDRVRSQSNIVERISGQTARLEEEMRKIKESAESPGGKELSEKLAGGMDSIMEGSRAAAAAEHGVGELGGAVREVSERVSAAVSGVQELAEGLKSLEGRIESEGSAEHAELQRQLEAVGDVPGRLTEVLNQIADLSAKAEKIGPLSNAVEGMQQAGAAHESGMSDKLEAIEAAVKGLGEKAEVPGITERLEAIEVIVKKLDGAKIAERVESAADKLSSAGTPGAGERLEAIETMINRLEKAGIGEQLGSIEMAIGRLEGRDTGPPELAERLSSIEAAVSKLSEVQPPGGQESGMMDRLSGIEAAIAKLTEVQPPGGQEPSDISARLSGIEAAVSKLSEVQPPGGQESGMTDRLSAIEAAVSKLSEIQPSGGQEPGIADRLKSVEEKISELAAAAAKSEATAAEFYKKSGETPRDAGHSAGAPSLSEYHAAMRMGAESKYGGMEELQSMSAHTGRAAAALEPAASLELRRWGISRILDCADRWEIRFSDVLAALLKGIDRDKLKEAARIKQVRDLYGARAVDELDKELG
ncbi:methyl-accepting chemotaxis protein [Cenarchaeum symbiosum A]|uniref:Methyl-accepting chemotaxis protein n=1 Tax=Cenarchaeum symbiosum (strain A) TaxID=414004 RepID=A0RWN5_CENSY|nr:methyl-accepting chemotaxis protein [Cenarchaeum symbiosum A]